MTAPRIKISPESLAKLADTFRKMRDALQLFGDQAADAMWDFVAYPHRPLDVGDEDRPEPWCTTCHVAFPCPKIQRLNEQRAKMIADRAERNERRDRA